MTYTGDVNWQDWPTSTLLDLAMRPRETSSALGHLQRSWAKQELGRRIESNDPRVTDLRVQENPDGTVTYTYSYTKLYARSWTERPRTSLRDCPKDMPLTDWCNARLALGQSAL